MSEQAQKTSPAEVEQIVFGDSCSWCQRAEPCNCSETECACTCGRCMFDGPLPDDGPQP